MFVDKKHMHLRRRNQPTAVWDEKNPWSNPDRFNPAEKTTLLDWINSSRSTYWCWLFISQATCGHLRIELSDLTEDGIPYHKLEVNHRPVLHNERLAAIKKYFEQLEKKTDLSVAYKVMRQMQDEWLFVKDKMRDLSWLSKNDYDTSWAWDYIRKLPRFRGRGLSSWCLPMNISERHMAIIAAFDEIYPDEYQDVRETIREKNRLISNFKAAYKKRTATKDCSEVQINIKVSIHVKDRLNQLAKDRDATQRQIIEQLIMNKSLD
ncbi:TPA: hypothetical protein ACY3HI_004761 [Citrobacter braakii]